MSRDTIQKEDRMADKHFQEAQRSRLQRPFNVDNDGAVNFRNLKMLPCRWYDVGQSQLVSAQTAEYSDHIKASKNLGKVWGHTPTGPVLMFIQGIPKTHANTRTAHNAAIRERM